MQSDWLTAVLRSAPRRYRMPALPDGMAAARAAGPETALAFAIEMARRSLAAGGPPDLALQLLFTDALAVLVERASGDAGDPAFQAQVLRASQPEVQAYAALHGDAAADERTVRAVVDAIAHPGKLRQQPEGAPRTALAQLHALASARDWSALRHSAQALRAQVGEAPVIATLQRLLTDPALARLERHAALATHPRVREWHALVARAGPAAGSEAAAARGRAAGQAGAAVEEATHAAFRQLAAGLDRQAAEARHRAVQALVPRGLPEAPPQAKDEWDVALLREAPGRPGELLLLAEAKAAPVAATWDRPRLLRGLARLARAGDTGDVQFAAREGRLQVSGASLRALAPVDDHAPEHVIYSCVASEAQVPLLAPAARTLLLQQRATLAHAGALAAGARPGNELLASVWQDLLRTPQLRPVLQQYATASAARAAMLHPDDLLAAAQGRPRNR